MDSPFASSILVTGGGGFLGRGILRYVRRHKIKSSITVYSRDEHKQHEMRRLYSDLNVRCVLGDIRDTDRLRSVMYGHETVIHAAAMKHIPEAERDAMEAIGVNVQGSLSVLRASMDTGVQRFVAISTDKACSPRNAYGATKMLMERSVQEAQRLNRRANYSSVRYGNVVSSTGSVIPIFKQHWARGEPIPITSPSMTRFWISIDDAVHLVEKALADQRRGHTYVARCPSMGVLDVAQAVWDSCGGNIGVSPDGRVPTKVIGVRPGEKMSETLVDSYEAPYAIEDDEYLIIPPAMDLVGERIGDAMPYDSSMPSRWMTIAEMISLIQDSEDV